MYLLRRVACCYLIFARSFPWLLALVGVALVTLQSDAFSFVWVVARAEHSLRDSKHVAMPARRG